MCFGFAATEASAGKEGTEARDFASRCQNDAPRRARYAASRKWHWREDISLLHASCLLHQHDLDIDDLFWIEMLDCHQQLPMNAQECARVVVLSRTAFYTLGTSDLPQGSLSTLPSRRLLDVELPDTWK